ncbi:MAG: hypothetical protein ABH868_06285 [bacterium]
MKTTRIQAGILLFVFAFTLYGLCLVNSVDASEPAAMFRGARPMGMGGTFIALADDQNAFFYNPAGLTQREKGILTVFEMPLTISKDMLALYKYYNDNKDEIENFDTADNATQSKIINDINDRLTLYRVHLTAGVPNINYISGPINFANGNKLHFGLGVFDLLDMRVKVNSSILVPTLDLWGSVDVMGMVPVAYKWQSTPFDLPGSVAVGATVKYIARGRISETRRSILELEDYDPTTQMGKGLGLDLGMVYDINEKWTAGMMIADFGGTPITFEETTSAGLTYPANTDVIKPRVNVGCVYRPSELYYWPGKSLDIGSKHLTLAADLNNITDADEKLFADTFFMKLHVGAELSWQMFALRGGLNKGYPTFGAGISFLFLKLDYAYYTDELGSFAGTDPESNHMITIAMRF